MSDQLITMTGADPAPPGDPVSRRPLRKQLTRIALLVLAAAMVGVYLVMAAPMMVSAVHHLAGASLGWLVIGFLATAMSMVVFAAVRRQTLRVAGVRIPLRRTIAVSYGAGALHITLPAGGVFSTTYAYRHLRAWGASTSATAWSMTVTGLLATVTLSAVGLTGVVLSGGSHGSAVWSIAEIAVALIVVVAVVRICRRPRSLVRMAAAVLGLFNRLSRRPGEAGFVRLQEIVADLRAIRPSGRDWTVAVLLSILNWALDLGCLAACGAAVGIHVSLAALLITYTAGMAAASLLPLPAGLGAVETAMTVGLTVAGAAASPALAAVLLYRLMSTVSVVVIGWIVVAAQRKQPDLAERSQLSVSLGSSTGD